MHPDDPLSLPARGFLLFFCGQYTIQWRQYFKLDTVFDVSGCSPSDGGVRKGRCTLMNPLGFPAGGFLLFFGGQYTIQWHQYFSLDSVFDVSGCSHGDGGERRGRCTLMTPLASQLGVFYCFSAVNTLSNGVNISS